MDVVNNDFEMLPEKVRKDYMIRKQILWESESCSETELSIVPARKGREQSEESGFYFQTTLSPIRNISRYDNYRIILHMSCKAGKCKSGV